MSYVKIDNKVKANLIKEALKIVDELAKYDIDDLTSYDKDELEELIDKAKKIKKNRLFVLK
ncbi:MAG: hypothetical protein PF487_07345 [Bacteroidales bacterium]|jgi:hypothetical protein|nr:hypothetical protein [Bacteroidales bacterium]